MSYFDHYLESRVLSANPLELVKIIYRGALDATATARQHFATGDIPARTRSLNRATNLVTELVTSLDPTAAPELEQNLRRLYDYVLTQINQAAIDQSPEPLDAADRILRDLLAAWDQIAERQDHDSPSPADAAISVSA